MTQNILVVLLVLGAVLLVARNLRRALKGESHSCSCGPGCPTRPGDQCPVNPDGKATPPDPPAGQGRP